jgi:hypothetical protein
MQPSSDQEEQIGEQKQDAVLGHIPVSLVNVMLRSGLQAYRASRGSVKGLAGSFELSPSKSRSTAHSWYPSSLARLRLASWHEPKPGRRSKAPEQSVKRVP